MIKTHDNTKRFDLTITQKMKIAIVRTDYYLELNENLEKKARETLIMHGVHAGNITTYIAPGSWEIPLIANRIAQSKTYDAIIAFGVIVKGQTYHFDMIANECGRGLMQISLDYGIPIANGILAVFDLQQAQKRASLNEKNKGIEAALAVLKAHTVLQNI